MRRDMQEVLERWGRWAASDQRCSFVDWPALSVLPCHKLEPGKIKCSDEDGITIDTCVGQMSLVSTSEDIKILGLRFLGGFPLRYIEEVMLLNTQTVRRSLRASEAFVEGCLISLSVSLDMDPVVFLPEPLACTQKPMLML